MRITALEIGSVILAVSVAVATSAFITNVFNSFNTILINLP